MINANLKERCDLFVENTKIMNDIFKWEMGLMVHAMAVLYTGKGIRVDKESIKACDELLKKKTSIFSEFRGNVKIPLICNMSLSNQPEAYFDEVETIYKMLNKSKWMGNDYKIMAAITICDHADKAEYEMMVERTYQIYERMKQEHKWLTSDEDIPFAAMLAVSGLDVDQLIEEMEKDYKLLKEKFRDSNAVQSLSHVLALDEQDADTKCNKVIAIYEELKELKHKYASGHELATLGTLAMLDLSVKETANLIVETDEYLKTQKGFGNFSVGATERRLYAAQLVLDEYGSKENQADGVVLGSMLALTIAMEICLLICMTSCMTAATASN